MRCRTVLLMVGLVVGVQLCTWAETVHLYISPQGDDQAAGTLAQPLHSLNAARDRLRVQDPKGGTIWLKGGRYHLTEVFELMQADSGTAEHPLVLRAMPGEEVILGSGIGLDVSRFKCVTDDKTLERLKSEARGNVWAIDLSGTALARLYPAPDRFGMFHDHGWIELPRLGRPQYSMLSWNGHLLQLAQWPNRGYGHIGKVIEAGPITRFLKPGEGAPEVTEGKPIGGTFTLHEPVDMDAWQRELTRSADLRVEGYFHNDWYFQQERMGAIQDGVFQLLGHTRYGLRQKPKMIPRRIRALNLLCELDQPGEWYYDPIDQKFYLWPIATLDASVSLTMMGGDTLVRLSDTQHVVFRDLIFENGGDLGLDIVGGSHNLVAGCTFRNFIGQGVRIDGGTHHTIQACDFYGLYQAFTVKGGERRTLTPCGHEVVNCHVYNCRQRGYGMVNIQGVGIRLAHSLFHDMNGAVRYQHCNDFVMEYCEFYNMGWEMGDWNVAYLGADWASYGNVLRYNFVHHLMEMPGAYPVKAFRNDDGGAGVTFFGNVFYKSGRGVIGFGGPGQTFSNNIIVGSPIGSGFSKAMTTEEIAKKWASLAPYDIGELKRGDKSDYLWNCEQICGKFGWTRAPWKEKYPTFTAVMNNGNPWGVEYCRFEKNYVTGLSRYLDRHIQEVKGVSKTCTYEPAQEIDPAAAFVDLEHMNFSFKTSFELMPGFETINFAKIGLIRDEYRTNPPDKDAYRGATREKLKDIPSHGGSYDMTTINERFPVPVYLEN